MSAVLSALLHQNITAHYKAGIPFCIGIRKRRALHAFRSQSPDSTYQVLRWERIHFEAGRNAGIRLQCLQALCPNCKGQ